MARSIARVEEYLGVPTLMIDGRPFGPMCCTSINRQENVLRSMGESGIRIHFIEHTMRWNNPGSRTTLDGTSETLNDLHHLLKLVPNAYIMLRMVLTPSEEWVNSHPDEQLVFNGGARQKVSCNYSGNLDGMWSFSSPVWQKEASEALIEFLEELKKDPAYEHVIGIFLCAGGTGEWYYPDEHRLHNSQEGLYADFSEPFRKVYARILKEKYGTQEELRRVWNDPKVTFEHPHIPDLTDRRYILTVDRYTREMLQNARFFDKQPGRLPASSRRDPNVGTLVNANTSMHTPDFFNAIHEATARAIVFFANAIKQYDKDMLVGAFYGYYGCTDYYDSSHTNGTLAIINSGKVDFLAGPCTYNNREPGGNGTQREMQDSLRLHHMLYFSEDDFHTHIEESPLANNIYGLYHASDSIKVLKREFARDICEDIQAWWFDMSPGRSWYDDDDILALFRRQQQISRAAYEKSRVKHNEIALIYDTESVHMVSDMLDREVLDYYRTTDIPRIGAPVDYYFHNDLSNPEMPDYKLYIMLNTYSLSGRERQEAVKKFRRNHAVVLWLYADGLYQVDAPRIMDERHMQELTGMKVVLDNKVMYPYYQVDPSAHPAVRFADPCRRYGCLDREIHSCAWVGQALQPDMYVYPGFVIRDPDVKILGTYLSSGETAYALKEMGGYVSAYCAAPVLRSELLASLAEYAGCHLLLRPQNSKEGICNEDILYANEHFAAVHASVTGTKTLYFKHPCDPFELYEEKSYGEGVSRIIFQMQRGETKMWSLDGPC